MKIDFNIKNSNALAVCFTKLPKLPKDGILSIGCKESFCAIFGKNEAENAHDF